jgi:hypothetical protein
MNGKRIKPRMEVKISVVKAACRENGTRASRQPWRADG